LANLSLGLCVADSEVPTQHELADARHGLQGFQRRVVAVADLEMGTHADSMFITDLERD